MRKHTILTASFIVAVGLIAVPTTANAANVTVVASRALPATSPPATTVSNSTSTPLSLKAKSGYAPLAVNSS